jgi:hypothetical protein
MCCQSASIATKSGESARIVTAPRVGGDIPQLSQNWGGTRLSRSGALCRAYVPSLALARAAERVGAEIRRIKAWRRCGTFALRVAYVACVGLREPPRMPRRAFIKTMASSAGVFLAGCSQQIYRPMGTCCAWAIC